MFLTTLLPWAWTAALTRGEPEDEIPYEAGMDDHRPGIFLIGLSHSDVVPTEYLWRQCAVFMAERESARTGTVLSAVTPQCGYPKTCVWPSLVGRSAGV